MELTLTPPVNITPPEKNWDESRKNKTPPPQIGAPKKIRARSARKNFGFLGRYARGNRLKSIIFGTPKSVRFEKK